MVNNHANQQDYWRFFKEKSFNKSYKEVLCVNFGWAFWKIQSMVVLFNASLATHDFVRNLIGKKPNPIGLQTL